MGDGQTEYDEIRCQAAKDSWDAATNTYLGSGRHADVYVFCVHTEMDRNKASPLDTDQWEFYVAPTSEIDRLYGNARTKHLSVLKRDFIPLPFGELVATIRTANSKT